MANRTAPGTRWSCRGCSTCCRVFQLGPVAPEVIAGLQAREIERHWAPAAEAPWYERRAMPDGSEALFLVRRAHGCVFLRDDGGCAVHGLFGAEAKPHFCRQFPFHVVHDPRGSTVTVRAECDGWHESWVDGDPVGEAEVAEAIALSRHVPTRTFAPERVVLAPGHELGLEAWLDAEARWVADPSLDLPMLRAELGALGLPLPEPDPARARQAAAALLEGLRRLLIAFTTEAPPPGTEASALLACRIRDGLEGSAARVAAAPGLDETARAWLSVHLRNVLLGRRWTSLGHVADGIGLQVFGLAYAWAPADEPVPPRLLAPAIGDLEKLCANAAVHQFLLRARPVLRDLFLLADRQLLGG